MSTTIQTTKANVVNGINVDDVLALRASIEKDPSKGITNWRVKTSWRGQTRSHAEVSGFGIGGEQVSRQFSFDADEPLELGGSNTFPNPQEYLLGALNACMIVGYSAQCAIRGITLERLEIETTGDIDLRGFLGIDSTVAPGYQSLSYIVRIKGDGTREQFAEVHRAVMATSPNFFSITTPVTLKPTLVIE